MDRMQAFNKAQELYGSKAVVGTNEQHSDKPFHVGVREHAEWVKFGAGTTWEEAFENVIPVFDLGGGKFKKRD